jgi:hypothetical protein
MNRRIWLVVLICAAGFAAGAKGDALSDLKARFQERYPKLAVLKKAGTIGETTAGLVELVDPAKSDAAAKELVEAENKDRLELYKILAEKNGTTPEKVAQLDAQRRFERAKPGEWLKGADGQWKKKEG